MQGKTINGYTLQRLLGTGGMAEVWYAENKIHKPAAVKILSTDLAHNTNIIERFQNEAEVMVGLNHPNIRQVYDFGDIDGRPAIIMEYLDGNDLKTRMKRGQHFTEEELECWWNQLVDALNYTHQKGIVHRDLKPGNIFVDCKGNIKLLDFGIAKVRESISSTQTGQKLGTLMYMSPEQVKDSKHIDYHTDIYSLAVTFVHLLTGKKPYDSDTSSDFEISEQIVYKPLDLSKVPAGWQGFLAPYLEKDPTKRPELRYFESVSPKEEPTKAVADADEGTIVEDVKQPEPKPVVQPTPKPQPTQAKTETVSKPQPKPEETIAVTSEAGEESKSKKGLWIALGAVAAVALLLVLLLKPKDEPVTIDYDTLAYRACYTIEDLRAYMRDYGRNGLHYDEAKALVDKHVADSIAQVQQALAEALALQQAEAEQQAQAEAEKKEDDAYNKCTTVAGCNSYLKTYPDGRYVDEVRDKKLELEKKAELEAEQKAALEAEKKEKAAYEKCTSVAACDSYLKAYPEGRYVDKVRKKREELSKAQEPKGGNGSYNGHDYIDLGLPSGTLWATCNVGATKPEGYGNYYAWGENRPKTTYEWSNYKYGSFDKLTKYCFQADRGNNGYTDNLTVLQSIDDAANANWGSGWKMPSATQWQELLNNTTHTWTTLNGVTGRLFRASNGNSIFLPATGSRCGSSLISVGHGGYYWSSSLDSYTHYARYFCISPDHYFVGGNDRYQGYSVRAVRSMH